ncbi:hypothetical protein [Rhodocaloribacter sp.]
MPLTIDHPLQINVIEMMHPYLTLTPKPTWMWAVCLFVLLVSGCDLLQQDDPVPLFPNAESPSAGAPASLSVAAGPATLTAIPSLVVPTGGASGGDLFYLPVDVPDGGLFSASLLGSYEGREGSLVRIFHVGLPGDRMRLEVNFDAWDVQTATVECVNRGVLRYRKRGVPLDAGGRGRLLGGEVTRGPSSIHFEYIEVNGEIIVKVYIDYEEDGGGTQSATRQPAATRFTPGAPGAGTFACTHIGIFPEQSLKPSLSVDAVSLGGNGIQPVTLLKRAFGPGRGVPYELAGGSE